MKHRWRKLSQKIEIDSNNTTTTMSDATAKAKKSAIILINFQNEFAEPGGKLHHAVAKVMQENDMMHKVEEVVETARKTDALVIHCPAAPRQQKSSNFSIVGSQTITTSLTSSLTRSQKSGRYLESGTWASEIVDEVKPVESDIVLEKRTSSSALEGTNLSSIIKENGIQNVILLGFLSEGSVVETAIGLSDEFPELNIISCHDGTASTKEKHAGAMKRTLPIVGVNVLSCAEAIDVIQTGNPHTEHMKFRDEESHTRGVYTIFEIASILGGSGVLIPSEMLVNIFSYGRSKSSNNESTDPFCSFSLEDIDSFVGDLCGEEENIPVRALKAVALDIGSVLNFVAGSLLIIGLFATHRSIGLFPSMLYVMANSLSTIGGPVGEWKNMINVEKSVKRFKQSIRMNAKSYSNEKRATLMKISLLAIPDNGHFVQQMQYIEEVIYSGNAKVLSQTEIEMLLVRELGTTYTSQTLDYVLSKASTTNTHTISPAEFHQFIATDDKSNDLSRAWFLFKHKILELGYIMGLSFGVASSLSVCNWGLREAGKGNNEYFHLAIIWLFLVGTLYFSNMAYKQVRDAYDAKEFARGLVDYCLRYSQYYNREHEVWKQFNETKSIDVKNGMKAFRQLLEFSDIFLSEGEVAELIQDLDRNGDGVITKEGLESYLDREPSNREISILRNCLRSFSFWSNWTWFIGAIGYAVWYYTTGLTSVTFFVSPDSLITNEAANEIGNIVGAIGYFCGGCAYCSLTFSQIINHLRLLTKLKYAMMHLLRTSRRSVLLHRTTLVRTLLQHKSLNDRRTAVSHSTVRHTDVRHTDANPSLRYPRSTFMNLDWMKNSTTLVLQSQRRMQSSAIAVGTAIEEENKTGASDPVEDFLSSIISHTPGASLESMEESGLKLLTQLDITATPWAGSLYSYQLRDHAGIILYPGCTPFLLPKLHASMSHNCSKLLINVPSHRPIKTKVEEETQDDSFQLSAKLIEDNFGPRCWATTLVEAKLPKGLNAGNSLSAPTLVYSRDNTQSLVNFKLIGKELNTEQQSERIAQDPRKNFSKEISTVRFAQDIDDVA